MKQYISPSSIAFELQTTSLMSLSTNDTLIYDSNLIQTQKKGGGIPWEDYMNYGQEDE